MNEKKNANCTKNANRSDVQIESKENSVSQTNKQTKYIEIRSKQQTTTATTTTTTAKSIKPKPIRKKKKSLEIVDTFINSESLAHINNIAKYLPQTE